jgi:hypothetical protein
LERLGHALQGSDLLQDFDTTPPPAPAPPPAASSGEEGQQTQTDQHQLQQGRKGRRTGPVALDEGAQQWGDLFFNEHDT